MRALIWNLLYKVVSDDIDVLIAIKYLYREGYSTVKYLSG